MKIYYFTSAMRENDFSKYKKNWSISLNPSGQNFHDKIIHAVSENNKVEVFSFIPFSKKYSTVTEIKAVDINEGDIIYHYLPQKRKKLLFTKELKRFQRNPKETGVVITDTLNVKVLLNAIYFAKRNNLEIIGICTDSPKNITGSHLPTTFLSLFYGKQLDGYICLTEGLNDAYNVKEKPNKIIHGIISFPEAAEKNNYGKYIFYGGSLMEKYGVYDLIEAFKQINIPDLKLLLCGHHVDKNKLVPLLNDNILYLGNLDYNDVIHLEQNALMCVNPRPLNNDIDYYAYPSKILEYLASGSLVVSTKNPLILEEFRSEIIWIKDQNKESFQRAIIEGLTLNPKAVEERKIKTKAKLDFNYSFSAVKNKIYKLIDSVVLK